jgi:hypothetical protein
MPLTKSEWQAVKDLRDEMVLLRDFCNEQTSLGGRHCCSDPDAECPISMGEWWDTEKNEKLKRVSNILFPDSR